MNDDFETKADCYRQLKDYFTTSSEKLDALWVLCVNSIGHRALLAQDLYECCKSHRYGAFIDTLKRTTPLRWTKERVENRIYYVFYLEDEGRKEVSAQQELEL